jgi:1,4-dihydroxy-2-naphthoate octaprenyltransferase
VQKKREICPEMTKTEAWFRAFRLRTLPLSFSSILLGSMLAFYKDKDSFNGYILAAALVTTLFLQILSNLANDYGDSVSGVDGPLRSGPRRAVQSGTISAAEMRKAIVICGVLALASGLWLLYVASRQMGSAALLFFFVLGLLAIGAAIKYTMGKNPYGYQGLGDLAVFIFFGLAGVSGTYYLHTQTIAWPELLPATAVGLLATGVLNLNNMRDIDSDRMAGKRSLVVMMGFKKARVYHSMLISTAILSAVAYNVIYYSSVYQFLFLISLPILLQNVWVVYRTERPSELDSELKKLAFGTLLFAITLGLGLMY